MIKYLVLTKKEIKESISRQKIGLRDQPSNGDTHQKLLNDYCPALTKTAYSPTCPLESQRKKRKLRND